MVNITRLIHGALEPAINQWWRAQAVNLHAHYFLWVRRAEKGEKIACPIIAETAPNEDWFLAMTQRLSIGWTKDQATMVCFEALQKCPILGDLEND